MECKGYGFDMAEIKLAWQEINVVCTWYSPFASRHVAARGSPAPV